MSKQFFLNLFDVWFNGKQLDFHIFLHIKSYYDY